MTQHNKISVDISDSTQGYEIDCEKIREVVIHTCGKFNIDSAQVSVGIVDDEQISQVHDEFMQDPTTTDVISFDLSDEFEDEKTFEMIVNADMAMRQSQKRGHAFQSELILYVLHGLLHNIGFDDIEEKDFELMHKTEDEILQSLGYGVIYGSRQE